MRRLAAVLLLAAGLAGCGAQPEAELAQGLRVLAAPQPDARAASVLLRRAARAGSARGAFYLAQLLRNGADGVPVDQAQAFTWMQRAAQGGVPEANLELAMAGQRGEWGITPEETTRYMAQAQHAQKQRPLEP